MQKKQYQTAKAEILRFEANDIITLSGFFGQEVSFGPTRKSSGEEVSIDWSSSFGEK